MLPRTFLTAIFQGIGVLGGFVSQHVHECTHLIAVKIARTEKFLSAISQVRFIVHKDWLTESIAQGKWLGELGV